MNIYKSIILGTVCAAVSMPAMAQNTRSGYFLEDYTYRIELNLAYGNLHNFIAVSVLGNDNMTMNGTLGVSDVI